MQNREGHPTAAPGPTRRFSLDLPGPAHDFEPQVSPAFPPHEAPMQRVFLLAALPGLFVAATLALAGGEPTKRQPVPAKKALAKAEDLVNDIFKEEIAKAKDP